MHYEGIDMDAATATDGVTARAAVYVRVSTGRQADEGFSLPEQDRRAIAYIQRQDGWTYVRTYREEGVSGGQRTRPALSRLLADLGDIDVVIVASLDRLGRSTKDLLDLCELFERAGVALVSLRDNIDTGTPVGRLLRTLLCAVAEFERDIGKERTSAGIGSRARTSGKPWGSTAAYGYRKTDNGHWEQDPAEIATYRRVFAERVEHGRAYNEIATLFNREAVPTRTAGRWTATTIRKILDGRYGLGEYQHGGEWLPGEHEAIITEATWETAQALSAMGDKFAPSRGGRRPPLHIFTGGLLRCSVCFEAMLPRTDGDKYVCRTNKQITGGGSCTMPSLKREDVDAAGLAMFERAFVDLDATRAHVACELDARLLEVEAQSERAGREVAEKTAQLARVERDYLAGTLSAATYERLRLQLAQDLAAAEAERERLTANADAVRGSRVRLDAEVETLRRLGALREAALSRVRTAEQSADVQALRTAMAQAFSAVYVSPDGETMIVEPMLTAEPTGVRVSLPLPTKATALRTSGVAE